MRPTEKATLHFDFSHLGHLPEDQEFTLHTAGKRTLLESHNDETLLLCAEQNTVLAAIPEQRRREKFTHFAEEVEFPADAISMHWVGYPSRNPDAVMDEIAVVFHHVPSEDVRRAVRAMRRDSALDGSSLLLGYGLEETLDEQYDEEYHEDYHVDGSRFVNYIKTALFIVMQHPEIGTAVGSLHERIQRQIVLRQPSFTQLWQYLSTHPAEADDPWYENTYVKDLDGNVMEPVSGLTDKDGKPVVWPTRTIDGKERSVIPQHNLSEGLAQAAKPVVQAVLKELKQQPWLKGQHWTTQHGVTVDERTKVSPSSSPVFMSSLSGGEAAAAKADWTIVNRTSHYGLDFHQESVRYSPRSGKLGLKVKNWPNRWLGAYVQFFDAEGKSVSGKERLGIIAPGFTYFGAPVWSAPHEISFRVPDNASGANILIGGLGNGNWDMDVDKEGIALTCVVSYGVPSFLLALTVGNAGMGSLLKELFKDEPLAMSVVTVAISLGLIEKFGPKVVLMNAAKLIGGLLFSPAVGKLAATVTGYATSQELVQAVPFVGWALKAYSIASAIADMTATSVEVGLSPATYTLEAKRSMSLRVVVNPDPTHGTSTQKPIWPKVSDHYVITVQYQGGTTLKKTGVMPDEEDAPIDVVFSKETNDALPSAPQQKFQILADIYSKTDWLCGKWTSGWIQAVPTEGNMRTEEGAIIEQLVPLIPTTRYEHAQKLKYDGPSKTYVWEKTHSAPSATVKHLDLHKQNVRKLIDITINNQAYKLGYAYHARNQNLPLDDGAENQSSFMYLFQSISTLANPGAGMKAPTRGFSMQPYIAYDQFGPAGLFELAPAKDYMSSLDKKGPVPADMKEIFTERGFPLPADAVVSVVTKTAAWRIGSPKRPLYDLRRQVDVIKVFNAPVPEFSPHNFYLDTRTYKTDKAHHLRMIDLHDDSGSTFDYDSGKSWGAFEISNLDAIAVHPNGYVIGISYNHHKMLILELPDAPMDDKDAPRALPFCGEGVREGLMRGPVGMTITADGRILVLERTNARIQAFDTQANPVRCFAAELVFDFDTSCERDLNDATSSVALLQALQKNVPVMNPDPGADDKRYLLTPVFSLLPEFAHVLNAGSVTEDLRDRFEAHGLKLGEDVGILATAQDIWLIDDRSTGVTYDIRYNGEGFGEVDIYRGFTPSITVKAPSAEWIIRDRTNTLSFDVKKQPAPEDSSEMTLHFQRLSSLMRLKHKPLEDIVYLDVGAETKGFIYVLSYVVPGHKPSDYRLDIYNPDGTPVTPDVDTHNGQVNAARMTVDQWRTLFTLNYQQMEGPAGRPEPTVSQWIPSTP